MIDLYKRVIDGVADLGFPLSIHLEATYGVSTPGVRDLRGNARLLVTRSALKARAGNAVGRKKRVVIAGLGEAVSVTATSSRETPRWPESR